VPQLLRHAAIAAAGLAAGRLLRGMHVRRRHVSVLDCDGVTKVRLRMARKQLLEVCPFCASQGCVVGYGPALPHGPSFPQNFNMCPQIPKHMLTDAVGPKPRHDPWRMVR
jgi:hypothetical protein